MIYFLNFNFEKEIDNEGFSLIELVVVVAVLAVLSAIALPSFQDLKLEFDGFEPMPRISRFLWGDWLTLKNIEIFKNYKHSKTNNFVEASYQCKKGYHNRKIEVNESGSNWLIKDEISRYSKYAILRWRLIPVSWKLVENSLESSICIIKINVKNALFSLKIIDGYESLFYTKSETIPVLEVKIKESPATIITEILIK